MTCGTTIRRLRKQAGMTQETLARQIQRCPATVSFYERNLRDIPTSIMVQIAGILHVTPGDLFSEEQGDDSNP